jgi:hypothetical protein
VKYYVTEPGSTWVRQLVDEEATVLVSAEITIAEVAAALGGRCPYGPHLPPPTQRILGEVYA